MADNDRPAGSSRLGGARTPGVRNNEVQASYERHSQKIKETWNISDVLDAFPPQIRPTGLGSSALTNVKNIAGRKTLAEARALFVHECRGKGGAVSTVGWAHTDKIWKAIKDETASTTTPGSTTAGSASKASNLAGANNSTPQAIPVDAAEANMEMRFKKKLTERAPKKTPPLIDPRTDPRSAPFAIPTSTSGHKTPTPRFDEHARGTTNPIGFLEPKVSPHKKARGFEEVGSSRTKQMGVNQEHRSSGAEIEHHNNASTKKNAQKQEKATNPPNMLPGTVVKNRSPADTQESKGVILPCPTGATQHDSTTIVVQPPTHKSHKKKKSSDLQQGSVKEPTNIAGNRHALGGTPKKRTIRDRREALCEDSPDTQATLVDDGIDLSRESPLAKKARVSSRTEAAAQRFACLDHNINKLLAQNEERIADVNEKNARTEAHNWSKPNDTMSDEELTPTDCSLESVPTTSVSKKACMHGSGTSDGKHSVKDSADTSVHEEIRNHLGSLPGNIRGFLRLPSLGRVKKEDPEFRLLAQANAMLATSARHLEADLAWLFKDSAN